MFQSKWISDLSAATPVADAARRVLTLRLEGVRDCLGYALREPGRDPEFVHQLRVATRRASAALEIFAECLPLKVYRTARSWFATFVAPPAKPAIGTSSWRS